MGRYLFLLILITVFVYLNSVGNAFVWDDMNNIVNNEQLEWPVKAGDIFLKALWWATITTFLGSFTAIFISTKLIVLFSGKGLVPDAIVSSPQFLISVGMGAAFTVFIATIIGIPISTTHSLTGALTGAGFASVGMNVNFHALGDSFFIPLLLSPAVSLLLTLIIYPCFKFARVKMGIERQMCLCIGGSAESICMQQDGTAVMKATGIAVTVDELKNCQQYYQASVFYL